MAIFVILPKNPVAHTALEPMVKQEFPSDHLLLDSGVWLISSSGTSHELAERLKILPEGGPSVMVFTITAYSGRAPNTVWEWLKTKMEAPPSG